MSNIETEVVKMIFDNAQFEAAIRKTLASLSSLNKGLTLTGATKGLDDVSKAAGKFNLGHIADSVDKISSRFSAMSVVAITALSNITSRAIAAGAAFVKSFTIAPITDGLSEYETQLNSIQTILSNTASAGTTLKDVNKTLNELNKYSDQTIYNFGEMARNIGTFTAAGVDLKTSTQAIKGIANLAALSGSNSQQASTAMYQLSQAISAGRVSLEDWNSVVNAGMGGTVFQRALAQNAEKMGTLDKGAVKLKGSMKNVTIEGKSFRESITAKPGEESWLTSDVLTRTLSQFTGDLSDAQLAAQGFNKEEIKAIQSQAKMAKNAATQVKTLSQLMGTLKESSGSGWAQTFQLIFGNFEEAKVLFTNVNNVLGGFITQSANARNKVLGDWKALGGRTVIIEAIANAFKAVVAFVKPIRSAFREIFPAKTGKDLYNLSVSIRNFTEGLKIGADTANKLKRTFAGVFAVFGIGVEIIKQVLGVIVGLFQEARGGSSSFLDVTASIGDFLVGLHKALVDGEGLKKFFEGLGKVLAYPIQLLQKVASFLGSAFSGIDTSNLQSLQTRLEPFGALGNLIAKVWSNLGGILKNVFKTLEPLASKIGSAFQSLMDTIESSMSSGNFSQILDALNTGLLGGFLLIIRKFLKNSSFSIFGDDVGGGVFGSITDAFENLTGTLKAMQTQLKASTLLKIAAAIALLAASVVALSLIDSDKLTKALTALSVMFTQLIVAMALFAKSTASAGLLKLPAVAAGLILLAIAIDLLVIAVYALSQLSWKELAKGLTGVVVLIATLVVATKGLAGNAGGMITAGAGLILLAGAIKILASAVTDLSGLSWEEMAQGLVGVGALLASLALFTKFAATDKGGLLTGAGIVLLAAGIKILASALKDISDMSWAELAKGLVGMAAGLTAIGGALILIPPSSILSAAAVLIAATALKILSSALASMGDMSWEVIAKGLTTLAASLGIIAGAMMLMTGALPGAAALLIVVAALTVLTPVLMLLGTMSWEAIAKGLTTLAAALAIIGIAGLLLTPVVPTLLGLGAAIALLGIGMAAAGAGVLLFATGLTALSIAGAAGAAALVGIVTTLIGAIPKIMELVGKTIVAFAQALAAAAPAVLKAMTVVISAILDAIVKLAPKILTTLAKLLLMFLQTLVKYVPKLVTAGYNLVIAILNGIAKKIGGVITAATNVVVAFLNGIQKNQGRILDAGVKLIISFVNGLAKQIRSSSPAMGAAGANLATAIVEGMVRGLASGAGVIASKARGVAQGALNAAKSALGIHSPSKEFEKVGKYVNEGFLKGLNGNSDEVKSAFNTMRDNLKALMKDSSDDVDRLTAKLKKLKSARHEDKAAIRETTKELAEARKELKLSSSAYSYLTKNLTDERDKLRKLASSYDALTTKLNTAKQALSDAKKTRDDFKAAITTQYSDLPDINENTKIGDYLNDLKEQIVKTKAFAAMLQKLRTLGLNDTLYKELLAKGTDSMPFVSQLLDSGKAGVDELNGLDKTLETTAASLGKTASNTLYQAAVNSAQGLVDGLIKQQKAIEKVMDKIADSMVAAIKKKLKIKSPSRVFAEIGGYLGEGLIKGLDATSSVVAKSAEHMGSNAVSALRKSMSGISDLVNQNVDLTPKITPVIDLTTFNKDAKSLSAAMPNSFDLSATSSYGQAKSARASYDANAANQADATSQTGNSPKDVSFTQNNYSPKALSTADIYRQTRNQLSVAKGALTT
jgi:tape measure domain-containing protein